MEKEMATQEQEILQSRPSFIGAAIKRREDPRLITGKGAFVDDVRLPHTVYLAIVRSPHAHARILGIQRPKVLPDGVMLVLTATDINAEVKPLPVLWKLPFPGLLNTANPVMAQEKVRYVGEPVALVVAENRYAAEDALELVQVDYEILPAVTDPEQALQPGAPLLYETWGSNVPCPPLNVPFMPLAGEGRSIEEAFAQADRVVKVPRLTIGRCTAASMETRGCVADYHRADDLITLYSSTQVPGQVRTAVATCLGLGENQVRVIARDVGGGFGAKSQPYPEEVIAAYLARKLGKPVNWIESRSESFVATTQDREQVHLDIEVAVSSAGRILGLKDRIIMDTGAAFTSRGAIVALITASMLPGPYRIDAASIQVQAVTTNKPPEGPYRGFGMPEATFVMERLMDIVATEIGMDSAEVRRRNLLKPDEVPVYQTPTGVFYDNGDYGAAFERALAMIGYDQIRAKQRQQREQKHSSREPLEGVGLSFVVEYGGHAPSEYLREIGFEVPGNELSQLEIDPSGRVLVRTGITSIGQGSQTTLAQIAASELGVRLEDVRVISGDTDQTPYSGMGATASRGVVVGGSALTFSCRTLLAKVKRLAAHLLEASEEDIEVRESCIFVAGVSEQKLTLEQLARVAYLGAGLPEGMSPGLVAIEAFDPPAITYAYAAHAARVQVDPETGAVEVVDYVCVHDCGTVINPTLVEGQIQGGVAQGIGQALYEQVKYGPDGQPLVTTIQDYRPPRAKQVPNVRIEHMDTPAPQNPLGAKGMGEGGTIGSLGAVCNAVCNAIGVGVTQTPMTPDVIWNLLHNQH
jgi:aerobic carbon-monoxide dehydrogenase large subunit